MEKSVNNLILDKVDNLVNYIKTSDEYNDYLFLTKKLSNNKKAVEYIDQIKRLQKEIIKKEIKGDDITSLEKEINYLLDELNKIPLYIDFINKQKELNEIYQYIKNRLDEYFYNILN